MHDLTYDFDSVSPDLWIAKEEVWKEKLLKLSNWSQVFSFYNNRIDFILVLA